jgi:hypothetical protein
MSIRIQVVIEVGLLPHDFIVYFPGLAHSQARPSYRLVKLGTHGLM